MQNPNAEHRTCTASQLHEKHNAQYNKKYINSHSAKQDWNNKKNCYRYQSSSQRSLSPFWFQLLTIFFSFTGRDFYDKQLLVFRIVKIKITFVTLITSYTNLATLKLDTHSNCSNSYRFYTFTPDIPICLCVYEVHDLWMSWQFLCFSLSSRTRPLWKQSETISVILSVGLPRTVCAFVSLTLDNILQQYVPRKTVAKFYPHCFFLLLWKISDQMISTILAPYEHVLITCCPSFQVFRGSVFCFYSLHVSIWWYKFKFKLEILDEFFFCESAWKCWEFFLKNYILREIPKDAFDWEIRI